MRQACFLISWQKGVVRMKKQDTYGEPTVFEYPNAIVRVCRPILSDEEQARRMKHVYKAAEELLKDVQKGGR